MTTFLSLEGRRVRNVGTYAKLLNEDDAFQQLVNEKWGEEEEEQETRRMVNVARCD